MASSSFKWCFAGFSKSRGDSNIYMRAKIKNCFEILVLANINSGKAIIVKVKRSYPRFNQMNTNPGAFADKLKEKLKSDHDFKLIGDDLSILGVKHYNELK